MISTEADAQLTPQQVKDEALARVAHLKRILDRRNQAARDSRDSLHRAARAAWELGAREEELAGALKVQAVSVGAILHPRPAE